MIQNSKGLQIYNEVSKWWFNNHMLVSLICFVWSQIEPQFFKITTTKPSHFQQNSKNCKIKQVVQLISLKSHHGCSGLDEPVESELWRLAYRCAQFIVDIFLVEAQLVQHADKEPVLLLCVVLAFVCPVLNPQLMERRSVPRHLYNHTVRVGFLFYNLSN